MSRPAGPVRLQVAVAVDGPDRDRLVSGLAGEGFIVVGGPVADALDLVLDADALVLAATLLIAANPAIRHLERDLPGYQVGAEAATPPDVLVPGETIQPAG